MVVVELGGGRTWPDAPIDHSVGLTAILEAGSTVQAGDDIAVLHAASEADWEGRGPVASRLGVGF